MKKLLYTGLMSIGLVLVATEDKKIYLMDFFNMEETVVLNGIEVLNPVKFGDVPSVDCAKINDLSDVEFKQLMKKMGNALVLNSVYYKNFIDLKELGELNKPKLHRLLFLINKCRPVLPFVMEDISWFVLDDWYSSEDIQAILKEQSAAE